MCDEQTILQHRIHLSTTRSTFFHLYLFLLILSSDLYLPHQLCCVFNISFKKCVKYDGELNEWLSCEYRWPNWLSRRPLLPLPQRRIFEIAWARLRSVAEISGAKKEREITTAVRKQELSMDELEDMLKHRTEYRKELLNQRLRRFE